MFGNYSGGKDLTPFPRRPGRGIACALFLALAGAFWGAPASADAVMIQPKSLQNANPFSTLVGRPREKDEERRGRPTIERYVLASDDRAFLFEDRGREARVQFLCTPSDPRLDCAIDPHGAAAEIYALTATRGPRGDVIYKNVQGDALLRIASYGGATVFWPGEPRGLAASKSFGDEHSLELTFTDHETALRRAQAATAIISALTGAPIVFEPGPPPAGVEGANAAVLADAVVTAAKGLHIVSDDPTGARVIASRIRKVVFIPDVAATVRLDGAVLEIGYVPMRDIDGRPSSAAVARFLEDTL